MVLDATVLRDAALRALTGVGDAVLGEWQEYSGYANHVRRRLSVSEQARVGPAIDVRGTAEAERRLRPVRHLLPPDWPELQAAVCPVAS